MRHLPWTAFIIFLILGVYSSYTDIRYRRVGNRLILCGSVLVLIIYLVSAASLINPGILTLNIIGAGFIALLLWRCNIWAAGDAKFFILSVLFALLLVPSQAHLMAVRIPLVFINLCNAFVMAFAYLFLLTLVSFLKDAIHTFKTADLGKTIYALISRFLDSGFLLEQGKLLLFYLAAFVYFAILGKYVFPALPRIPVLNNPILLYIFMLSIYAPVRRILGRIHIAYLVLILISAITVTGINLFLLLFSVFKFFVFFGIVSAAINEFIRKKEVKVILTEELKPYYLLSYQEVAQLPQAQKAFGRFYADGLTKEQVEQLKNYFRSIGKNTIQIYNTFPFIPFIALSTAIVFFIGGRPINILFFLY